MKRSVAALALLAAFVVAVPAAFASARPVPFSATSTLVSSTGLVPRAPCGPAASGYFGRTDVYSGTATHLGRFTLTANLCLNLSTFSPPAQSLVPYSEFGVYVAANGDTLAYLAFGTLNLLTGTSSHGFSFLGGTGRFENVEGGGTTVYALGEGAEFVGLEQTGTIEYESSDLSH